MSVKDIQITIDINKLSDRLNKLNVLFTEGISLKFVPKIDKKFLAQTIFELNQFYESYCKNMIENKYYGALFVMFNVELIEEQNKYIPDITIQRLYYINFLELKKQLKEAIEVLNLLISELPENSEELLNTIEKIKKLSAGKYMSLFKLRSVINNLVGFGVNVSLLANLKLETFVIDDEETAEIFSEWFTSDRSKLFDIAKSLIKDRIVIDTNYH